MFGLTKTHVTIDDAQIEELLTRGVEEVIEKSKLLEKLKSGKQLRIKLGIDPTSPNIHLGRAITLLKLRDFQNLGHKIVFIIGDFTAVIGDTSDKDSERPMLSSDLVKENMKRYVEQASKILDIHKCEIRHNSEWLGKLSYHEIGTQADAFSLSDFIARENIKRRLDGGKRVSLRELLYPLMQGYDSVAVKADVEIGGTDQRFNLLAGRELQRHYKQPAQDIVTNPIIEGLDGRKMSSSFGNGINLFDSSQEIYGKTMSLRDDLIIKYFTLVTRVPMSTIREYEHQLVSGTNPRDIKMKLAYELVKMYHSDAEAKKAEISFVNTFTKGAVPDDVLQILATPGAFFRDLLVQNKVVTSNSEWRRLVEGKGVSEMDTDKVITDQLAKVEGNVTLRIGKKRFVKIVVK